MISDSNQNKKPLIFYMAVAVIVIMLLNAFVFPMLLQRQVQEVGYSDFLKMVDSKQVSEANGWRMPESRFPHKSQLRTIR